MDIRHKPTANDLVMHDWFRETGCPEIVVANKLDKLKKSQVEPALELIRETLELTESGYSDPLFCGKGQRKGRIAPLAGRCLPRIKQKAWTGPINGNRPCFFAETAGKLMSKCILAHYMIKEAFRETGTLPF